MTRSDSERLARAGRLGTVAEAIRVKYGGMLAVARRLGLQHPAAFAE